MDTERNALAELAEKIQYSLNELHYSGVLSWYETDLRKAQLIVAELAKCWKPKAESELVNDYVSAMANIRAIAEEGANNEH